MACLYKSDLSKNLTSVLENDVSDANKMKATIDNFVGNAENQLKGDAYKKGINQLKQFSDIIDKRIEVMNDLSSAITSAMAALNDYMGEYEVLDDSKLEELNETITRCENELASLESNLYYYVDVEIKDANGVVTGTKKEKYVNQAIQDEIHQVRSVLLEIKAEKEKIENLNAKIEEVYNTFCSSVDAALSNYEASVSGINIVSTFEVV